MRNCFCIWMTISILSGCTLTKTDPGHYYEINDADVYLVPIGPVHQDYLRNLVTYYEDVASLKIDIAPPLPYQGATYDSARKQLIAQNLIALMNTVYKNHFSTGTPFLLVSPIATCT